MSSDSKYIGCQENEELINDTLDNTSVSLGWGRYKFIASQRAKVQVKSQVNGVTVKVLILSD